MIRIFVYGTLKPGEINDRLYADMPFSAQPAIIVGNLYALPLGYPALTPGTSRIEGVWLTFALADAALLERFDRFEHHCPKTFQRHYPGLLIAAYEYQRSWLSVLDCEGRSRGQAWAYTMTTEQAIRLGGIRVLTGNWNRQVQADCFRH